MSAPGLTLDLLVQPASRAVRIVARARVEAMTAAFDKFRAGEADALHDFRVSVRRLRSWIRAFRPELDDTLRGKTRRSLRQLARLTNAPRDAEIGLTWIGGDGDFQSAAHGARRFLLEAYTHELDESTASALEKLQRRLPKLADRLTDEFSHYWRRLSIDSEPREDTMGATLARVLDQHAARMARAIKRVEAPDEVDRAHRARIAAKRLRYLLELVVTDQRTAPLVAHLTQLQDALGEFHDTHVLEERIVAEAVQSASDEARERIRRTLADEKPRRRDRERRLQTGLLDMARHARRRGGVAFKAFEAIRDIDDLIAGVDAISADLPRAG